MTDGRTAPISGPTKPPAEHPTLNQDHALKLFLRQRTLLYAYIRSIVNDDHRAEDVLQNVCLILMRKHENIRDDDHLAGWLRTTARLEAMNLIRQHHQESTTLHEGVLAMLESEWDHHRGLEQTEILEMLRGCLERLTPYARQLVDLRYREALTGEQLAQRVGRRVNAVYVALTRVHHKLADCMSYKLRGATHLAEARS